MDTAESELFRRFLDFLGEYEAICETDLAPKSGTRGYWLMKKYQIELLFSFNALKKL
jgi:hypothetical protein